MEQRISFRSDGLTLPASSMFRTDYPRARNARRSLSCTGSAATRGKPELYLAGAGVRQMGLRDAAVRHAKLRRRGEPNRINCLEQVEDTKNAITFMQGLDEVDADRIGLIGSSFGATVTVYTAGVDERVSAAISSGGWGDGERKFRGPAHRRRAGGRPSPG